MSNHKKSGIQVGHQNWATLIIHYNATLYYNYVQLPGVDILTFIMIWLIQIAILKAIQN